MDCYSLIRKFMSFFFLGLFHLRSLQRALDRRLYLLLYGKASGAPSDKPVWHFPEKFYETEETLRKVRVAIFLAASSSFLSLPLFFSFHINSYCLQCAETALESVIGDLSHTYFVGNAPMGHMVILPTENESNSPSFKVYFLDIGFTLLWLLPKCIWQHYGCNSCNLLTIDNCCINFNLKPWIVFLIWQRFFFKSQVIATNKFKIGKCEDFAWVTKDEILEYFPEQAEFLNKMIIS